MSEHFFDRMGLNPKQRALCAASVGTYRSNAIVGYGGAGGGGKSHGLRASCVYALLTLAGMGHAGAPVMLACADYPRLSDRHIGKLIDEYSWLGAKLTTNAQHRLHIAFKGASSLGPLLLRNLAKPDGYRGSECAHIAVDELTEIPERVGGEPVMALLLYPLRNSQGWPFNTFAMGTNPDGIGHHWVKAHWITGVARKAEDRDRYVFIPAYHQDNPHLGAEWLANLEYFTEETRRMRLEGLWDRAKGLRWPNLDERTHLFSVASRFPQGIPREWRRYMGVDYGLQSPFAAIWAAEDPATLDLYVYRVLYKSGWVAEEQAHQCAAATLDYERVTTISFDPAMFNRKHREIAQKHGELIGETVAADYGRVWREYPQFGGIVAADNGRSVGFGMLDRYLYQDRSSPNVYIADRGCEALWKELVEAQWQQSGKGMETSEELDSSCADHAIDALRYLLMGAQGRTVRQRDTDDLAKERQRIERSWNDFYAKHGDRDSRPRTFKRPG